ncbi:acetoacetate--CoA ligase [Piscinibacter sp. XHJ-5]|uniref:acetoacetate--CoA ligase n=1 Tax=Piscinibacter sp. XHJ-5 TaxID=3037797 RepID=UPI0024535572|nr:acetoacetate--CoA ligase [Piscinibacter sp. XHJ-5]
MSQAPEPQILRYTRWLAETRGLRFDPTTNEGYDAMWRWSVCDLRGFWRSVWDWVDLQSPTPVRTVLDAETMPGARWFEGAQVNFARQALRHADAAHAAGHPALRFQNEAMAERGEMGEMSWPDLRRQVAALTAQLERMGVQPGDRVAAFLPNTPATVVAFLAVASLGAVWSVCSPDMGPVAVLDRFRQIEPTVLIACDGYRYGGVAHDRMPLLATLLASLPSVRHVVLQRALNADADEATLRAGGRAVHDFDALTAGAEARVEPRWLPFDHPLWIVYSSGTTGLPKPIVHGHGGVMLEGLKLIRLHNNVGPSVETGDRFHWYSATGWIMWNCQMMGLLIGTTICLFDGSPAGRAGQPDWSTLWRFVGAAGATFFGAGAAFYASCLKAGVEPARVADLSRLRGLGSTGSPLPVECYRWIYEQMPKVDGRDIWLTSVSGGTDFSGGFIAGLPTLPVIEGEMQCRCLGASVEAWSEPDAEGRGRPLIDEVGELVCTKPMPSMPLCFWGDTDGRRLHDSYFDMYPGVWRHGDWLRITPRGGAIIYGRSDATINRHGIRMGTSELYRAVEALPEVLDSLVVDLEYLGRESYMPLFVVLREGFVLDDALVARLKAAIREALSARHVPNEIFQVSAIPRTLSGKKMELPVKKLLMGQPAEKVLNADAMANADSISWFVEFGKRRAAS